MGGEERCREKAKDDESNNLTRSDAPDLSLFLSFSTSFSLFFYLLLPYLPAFSSLSTQVYWHQHTHISTLTHSPNDPSFDTVSNLILVTYYSGLFQVDESVKARSCTLPVKYSLFTTSIDFTSFLIQQSPSLTRVDFFSFSNLHPSHG